jgi:hypothetical protein
MAGTLVIKAASMVPTLNKVPLDDDVEVLLKHLLRNEDGLPRPDVLELLDARWGGHEVGSLHLAIEPDGTLKHQGEPPSRLPLCEKPSDWTPELLVGKTKYGPLLVEQAVCTLSNFSCSLDGSSRMEAHLQSWKWSATSNAVGGWWAGKLCFATGKVPYLWLMPEGNVLVAVDGQLHRLWRISINAIRQAFFGGRGDQWFILVQSEPGRVPSTEKIRDLMMTLSFTLGEPITVHVLFQISASGDTTGIARLDLTGSPTPSSRMPPALPFMVEAEWFVRFVERALVFMTANPGGIVHVAMHCYVWALLGTIDMKLLQNWVGTEALAGWMLKTRMVPTPPEALLVRDAEAWRKWVVDHEAEITAFTAAGSGNRLLQRVMSASAKVASKVEKVFVASGLPWTPEMDDVQNIRNAVTHAAVIAPVGERDWTRDRCRVGLMQTMLTALLAKVIGYDGPIADRSKTCFNSTGSDQPDWWTAGTLDSVTDHWARDIPEKLQ